MVGVINGYIENKRKGRKIRPSTIFLVKSSTTPDNREYGRLNISSKLSITLPDFYVGKRIRLKVELVDKEND